MSAPADFADTMSRPEYDTDRGRPWAPDPKLRARDPVLPLALAEIELIWTRRFARFGMTEDAGPLLGRRGGD